MPNTRLPPQVDGERERFYQPLWWRRSRSDAGSPDHRPAPAAPDHCRRPISRPDRRPPVDRRPWTRLSCPFTPSVGDVSPAPTPAAAGRARSATDERNRQTLVLAGNPRRTLFLCRSSRSGSVLAGARSDQFCPQSTSFSGSLLTWRDRFPGKRFALGVCFPAVTDHRDRRSAYDGSFMCAILDSVCCSSCSVLRFKSLSGM